MAPDRAPEQPAEPVERPVSTRDRLIRAAIAIADEDGVAAITTVRVTREAGIAQSSYYTHFASLDELLEAVGRIGADHSRRSNRTARLRFRDDPDPERQRDLYRVPLEEIRAHPDLFRLQLRARTEPPSTPLGRAGAEAAEASRRTLTDDLLVRGAPADPVASRRRYEMLADCINAMVEQLGIGNIEGRYPDDEELIDLLVLLTRGNPALGRWLDWRGAIPAAATHRPPAPASPTPS
ncbi:hypothetical protein BH10ACT1_BH10ACT1_05790 [soil metagenome]